MTGYFPIKASALPAFAVAKLDGLIRVSKELYLKAQCASRPGGVNFVGARIISGILRAAAGSALMGQRADKGLI